MTPQRVRLSKSKIAAFDQCPKRLWLQVHAKHLGEYDRVTLERFKIGHAVGERARAMHSNGELVQLLPDIPKALEHTRQLVAAGDRPIFEATFQHDDVLVAMDVLEPTGDGTWRAIEVKASSRVKPYALRDIATQVWVASEAGALITSAVLRLLAFPLDWFKPDIKRTTFRDHDITDRIDWRMTERAETARAAHATAISPMPEIDMGSQCIRPFSCEFAAYCRRVQPPQMAFDLRRPM